MALKMCVTAILMFSFHVFADHLKILLEESIYAIEQENFSLDTFEKKIETLCLNKNEQACNI